MIQVHKAKKTAAPLPLYFIIIILQLHIEFECVDAEAVWEPVLPRSYQDYMAWLQGRRQYMEARTP